MQERDYYLAFSLVNGIGPKTFELLLKHFNKAQKAWNAGENELKSRGFSERIIKKILIAREEFDFEKYQNALKIKKTSFIALCDKEYPKLLAKIPNPPIVLFVKGDISKIDFEKTIGVVGTRRITNYGREVTDMFSSQLSVSGFTIISGLAMGVDAQAAWSAVNAGGKTIAVLGNGVDLCFPSSNEALYDKILDGNGIIVSEFPIGQTPTIGSFPSRNRIIAGLSQGVLVTEGAQDSGSLITADYAFKFNRKVFAIPGPITSSLSVAPLKLIGKGAKLVTSVSDIAKELNIKIQNKSTKKQNFAGLSKEEEKIINLLENENLAFDQLVRKTGVSASKLASILSMLELKGVIKNNSGSYALN